MAPEIAGALAVAVPMGAALAWVWVTLNVRISKIEAHWENCEERWRREVMRGARLAATPVDPLAPTSIPPPDWEEPTGVRDQRALLEAEGFRAGLAETLRKYLEEHTPPRARLPSKPRIT